MRLLKVILTPFGVFLAGLAGFFGLLIGLALLLLVICLGVVSAITLLWACIAGALWYFANDHVAGKKAIEMLVMSGVCFALISTLSYYVSVPFIRPRTRPISLGFTHSAQIKDEPFLERAR